MVDDRAAGLLALAAELEAVDEVLAEEISGIDELADRVAAARARAVDVSARLATLPGEQAAAVAAERAALADEQAAREALVRAEARIESLGRRTSQDERDQAERELTRAREDVHDAGARLERARAQVVELGELDQALRVESDALVVGAAAIAAGLGERARVADAGKGSSGATLAELEEWGARARAALFVARGALATERERIVLEANALGSSVLGEPLGGSSVSLVRRRLEEALAADV